jgi:hypothetical protein
MLLVQNFEANNTLNASVGLTWDRPLDSGYNALTPVTISGIVSNTISLSSPVNAEVGYIILQAGIRRTVVARGVQVSSLTLDSAAGLADGPAQLQATTNIIIQRKKDAFPVELATGTVYTQNVAVEIFNGFDVIGNTGQASKDAFGNNILTDSNANFSANLVGRILRDSSSFNFLITAVLSSTQLQVQGNDTLHNGPYIVLVDFPQTQSTQTQPVNYLLATSGVGVITDPGGFLTNATTNTFAQPHELIGRIVLDSNSIPYVVIDNTATQLFISDLSMTPNVSVFPGYTILPAFNGINTVFSYTDNFISATEANARAGTGLEQNQWYYYTAFTKTDHIGPAGENYAPYNDANSTQAYALSTGNYQFGNLLYEYFPDLYQETDSTLNADGVPAASGTGNLQDLMSVFGIQFDELYSLVETFRLQYVATVSESVLDQFCYQLNIPPPDYVIGRDTLRRIANNLINVYENKGNKIGIAEFIRIITTWDITGGTGDINNAILDSLPNVNALRFFSSALGVLNTRLYGIRTIVPTFTPTNYNGSTGIVSVALSVDLSNVQIGDYMQLGDQMYQILGGIESTPVPNGNVLFSNSSSLAFTYSPITGVVQYSGTPDLTAINPGDIFFDGNDTPYVIISVNSGAYNVTIATGQSLNTTPAPNLGGSIQQGELQFRINTGLVLTLGPLDIVRINPEVVITPAFTPSSYTSGTGVVTVPDSADLSNVEVGDLFTDAADNQFAIIGGISDVPGSKQFQIATGQTVSLSMGAIIERISQQAVGQFLKQLPGIIIPGFFTFREFVIYLPYIAMFIAQIQSITESNGQATINFGASINFGQTNGLAGCIYYPNEAVVKEAYTIISNTATSITISGIPQFAQNGDTSVILTPLNSARFQRLADLIGLVSPFNTRPGFSFIDPIAVPI